MSERWKVIERKFLYKSNSADDLSVRSDLVVPPSGTAFRYTYIDCPYEVVFVLGVDERERVVLIKQFRFIVNEWLWEVPAGSPENGESLEAAARREFEEESGLRVDELEYIRQFYPSVGITNQRGHLFLGRGISAGRLSREVSEDISKVCLFSARQLSRMLRQGEIKDAGTLIALLALKDRLAGKS